MDRSGHCRDPCGKTWRGTYKRRDLDPRPQLYCSDIVPGKTTIITISLAIDPSPESRNDGIMSKSMNSKLSLFQHWIPTSTSRVTRHFVRVVVATMILFVGVPYTFSGSHPLTDDPGYGPHVSGLQQEPTSMLGHGLIRTPPLTRESIEHLIHLAAEAGADERKLRELAAEGTERLLTCPEFAFVWQRTWQEYSTVP